MHSLDNSFQDLLAKLREPETLNPALSDPIFYFAYPSEQMLELKKRLPRWIVKLRDAGFKVKRISLSDLMWQLIDDSGRWEMWLALEHEADLQQLNEVVRDVLRSADAFIEKIAECVCEADSDTIVLLTEAELLHPYFRTRTLESRLHDRVRAPTVFLYPGRRSGQYGLHFLGFYPVDGNYRSTIVGGY